MAFLNYDSQPNFGQQWSPWRGLRRLPKYTAPRTQWTRDPVSGSLRGTPGKVTQRGQQIRSEIFGRGGPRLIGDTDYNPRLGTTGGIGYKDPYTPPLIEEDRQQKKRDGFGGGSFYDGPIKGERRRRERDKERGGGPGWREFDLLDPTHTTIIEGGRKTRGGGGGVAPPPGGRGALGGRALGGQVSGRGQQSGKSLADQVFGREQVGGMATGDPAGRQQQGGQATGSPVTDLSGYMSWLGNDDQATKILYEEFIRNGWELPDNWQDEYTRLFNQGATFFGRTQEDMGLNDADWAATLKNASNGVEYAESRNQDITDYIRTLLQQGKAEFESDQIDPTLTDPETDNIYELGDRDQSEGTGFPWAPNIQDPFSQNAPEWAQQWVDQMGTLMPQITDQYRVIANKGIYGEEGQEYISDPLRQATNRVMGSLEPFINETTQGIRQSEANQRRRAGQALQSSLGRLGAQRPGAAAQSIATNITAPSMVAESDRIFDARQGAKEFADSLMMNMGGFDTSLRERDMASKAGVGLPGMQSALAQQAGLLQQRPWDFSMENKFGWSPERSGEIQMRVQDFLMNKGYSMDWNMSQLGAQLGDWGGARSQQRQYEYQSLIMELKQKYDKEMIELMGPDWEEKLLGGIKDGAYIYATGGGGD